MGLLDRLKQLRGPVPDDDISGRTQALVVRGGPAEIRLDRPAAGWPPQLPEAPFAEVQAKREGAPVSLDDPEVLRLWPVVRVWYERMRATDARTRMGNAAFETMLREHGYW